MSALPSRRFLMAGGNETRARHARSLLCVDGRSEGIGWSLNGYAHGFGGCYGILAPGDERSRRRRMATDRKPRGADLAKSAQQQSANRTSYSALPLAA